MGWGTLPAPGTKLGPCVAKCSHVDCALTRKDAEAKCRECGEPIGFETAYYRIGGAAADLVHEART